ncbi:MAG: amidohydrolase/deacetylase family metallohydrolase [Bryobacterales bacterium]|nr:amidohydrolase/deacetylase family metallohydrolase [Bryobacterales bacterium]
MQRRTFLGLAGAVPALGQRRWLPYDLVIRNGELRDPSQGLRRQADIGIAGDKIAAIEGHIDPAQAIETIDAKGLMVTPGLVDLHTHCFHSATGLGVEADPIAARSGVTTWVDAGSFAWDQAAGFRRFIVHPAQARIYGYVYLYPNDRNPDDDVIKYVRRGIEPTGKTVEKNRDILLGVKFQVGSNMNGRYSLEMLKAARELCDRFQLPLMAHISFAPPSTAEVMALMKKGDVVTHCYNGHSLSIVDEAGKVKPEAREARERGVWFDVGHGLGSFNFAAAKKALDAGFVCDSISTDIYNLNLNGPVYDMPTTMSKLLYLGMSVDDVILRTTANPAKVVNRVEGMGQIKVGGPADLALLEVEEGQFRLIDSQRNAVSATKRFVSRGTIVRGRRMRVI